MTGWPFLFVAALFSLNPITLTIYPAFAMRPATFRITVLVPRHEQNRRVCWQVDGPELKRSCLSINGAEDRKSWTVYWELRTAGEYLASAILTRSEDGRERIYREDRPFRVIGMELEP